MALSKPRKTASRLDGNWNNLQSLGVKTATTLFVGGLVCTDSTGYAVPGATATGLVAAGVLVEQPSTVPAGSVTNSGASGTISVDVQTGCFLLDNSSGDPVSVTSMNKLVYIVDDASVAATDGTGSRSIAGVMRGLETATGQNGAGVWVDVSQTAVADAVLALALAAD